MFFLRAGDSISERVGGEMNSLVFFEVFWMDSFAILEALEIYSLLVSELRDMQEKTIKLTKIMKRFFMKVNT